MRELRLNLRLQLGGLSLDAFLLFPGWAAFENRPPARDFYLPAAMWIVRMAEGSKLPV